MAAQNAMEKMTSETKVVMSMLCFCCWSIFYPCDLSGWLVVTGVVDRIIQRLHQTMTNGKWANHFSWSSNTAKEQKEQGPHLQSPGPRNNVIQFWDNKRLIAAFQKTNWFLFSQQGHVYNHDCLLWVCLCVSASGKKQETGTSTTTAGFLLKEWTSHGLGWAVSRWACFSVDNVPLASEFRARSGRVVGIKWFDQTRNIAHSMKLVKQILEWILGWVECQLKKQNVQVAMWWCLIRFCLVFLSKHLWSSSSSSSSSSSPPSCAIEVRIIETICGMV